MAAEAAYIFLGVKPQMMAGLLSEIAPVLAERRDSFVLVTMAAGLTMERIAAMAGGDYPVIRIMPNTPCAVGAGVVLYDANERVSEAALEKFTAGMAGAGLLDRLEERLIDAGSAVAGCGPAFLCLFLEGLADGGVACGLPRQKALRYAAQMAAGTAQMAANQHPGAMKDAVCSPGGSTIAGVRALERAGLRSAAMEAVIAALERNQELANRHSKHEKASPGRRLKAPAGALSLQEKTHFWAGGSARAASTFPAMRSSRAYSCRRSSGVKSRNRIPAYRRWTSRPASTISSAAGSSRRWITFRFPG